MPKRVSGARRRPWVVQWRTDGEWMPVPGQSSFASWQAAQKSAEASLRFLMDLRAGRKSGRLYNRESGQVRVLVVPVFFGSTDGLA